MSCNCGLNELFTNDVSLRDARKYQRRGLDRRARRMLRALEEKFPLKGRSTLEIGIGTGGFTVEMLRRGTAHAVGVDAVPNQLAQAHAVARHFGVADKLELLQGDFTNVSDQVDRADVVVLDRVVCCYPNWRGLLERAAEHARTVVVMSYPRRAWYTRVWIWSANLAMKLLRREFRLHLHPPQEMQQLLRKLGFTPQLIGHRVAWEMLIAVR